MVRHNMYAPLETLTINGDVLPGDDHWSQRVWTKKKSVHVIDPREKKYVFDV